MFYSWLSGHAIVRFLTPALSTLFNVNATNITQNGDDDPANPETFAQSAKADLLIESDAGAFLIEVQAGFQGKYNDIKKHKINEAHRAMRENRRPTICTMFDVFNGRVGFVRLDVLPDDDQMYTPRGEFENQLVYEVPDEVYRWLITDPLPTLDNLDLNL